MRTTLEKIRQTVKKQSTVQAVLTAYGATKYTVLLFFCCLAERKTQHDFGTHPKTRTSDGEK